MAAFPLINIIGNNHVLSMPLLKSINGLNRQVIQKLKEEVRSAESKTIWIAANYKRSCSDPDPDVEWLEEPR